MDCVVGEEGTELWERFVRGWSERFGRGAVSVSSRRLMPLNSEVMLCCRPVPAEGEPVERAGVEYCGKGAVLTVFGDESMGWCE
jgi:hypothetical protein